MSICTKILKDLHHFFADSVKDPSAYRHKPTDFTRKRKLHFSNVCLLILGLLKKSLQLELNIFFKPLNTLCTKSAFCQARRKLNIKFFEDIFNVVVESYYKYALQKSAHKFKSYRLWACDTSIQLLPDNTSTQKLGIQKYGEIEIASIKISAYFDVKAKIIACAGIFDKSISDLFCCLSKQVINIPSNVISIYDRGYGSLLLAYLHDLYGKKYVVRLKTDFSNAVKRFVSSTDTDIWITEKLGESARKSAKELNIPFVKGATVRYRLVKIVLSTGEIEVLMTNLPDTFTISDLSYIYKCRWGIEDCFKVLKTNQMLAIFSGYSATSVLQDIWSNLLFYNLQTITLIEAEKKLDVVNKKRANKPSKRKIKENKGYKINRNLAIGILKIEYKKIFVFEHKKLSKLLNTLTNLYGMNLELMCDKSPPRGGGKLKKQERHKTEYNYKQAF
jgi:hypothetical protein